MNEENTFPPFPNFRKLKPSDARHYEAYYAKVMPYADLTMANLFVWFDLYDDLSVSSFGATLVLRFTSILQNKKTAYYLCGEKITPEDLTKLFQYQMARGDEVVLREIPSLLLPLDDSRFIVYDDRDNYEYIYSVPQQARLEGKLFSRHRRKMSSFARDHKNVVFTVEHRPYIDHVLAGELEDFMIGHDTMDDASEENVEPLIIPKALTYSKKLGKEVFLIRMDNELIAFCVFVRVGTTAIVNHIKVNREIQYLFDYATHRLAQYLDAAGIQEMNFEQDLGLQGLRDHKTRLRPTRLLEKSCIMPKYL